jgi:hypothetical protein
MIKNKEELNDINCKIWKIKFNEANIDELANLIDLLNDYCDYFCTTIGEDHFLLDMNKEHFSLLEKIVYDIAVFHFKKLNITNLESNFVTFWFRNIPECCIEHHNIHIDKNTDNKNCHNKILPLITTITYLCEHENPTIITDIQEKMNTEKKFTNENTRLTFSFPKVLKQVSCNFGKYYHGECHTSASFKGNCASFEGNCASFKGNCFTKNTNNVKKRNVLALALWDKEPGYRNFYNKNLLNYMYLNKHIPINKFKRFNKETEILNILERNENKINIRLNGAYNNILNDDFYDNILNKGIDNEIYKFSNLFEQYKDYDVFTFNNGNNQITTIEVSVEYNLIIKNVFTNNELFDSIYNQYIIDKNIISIIDTIIFNFNGILFSLNSKTTYKNNTSFTINNMFITNNQYFAKLDENKRVCLILLDEVDELNNIVRGDVILNVCEFTIENKYYICYLLTINEN